MPLLGGGINAGEREKDFYGLGKNPCVLSVAQHFSAGITARKGASPGGTVGAPIVPTGLAFLGGTVPSTKVLGYGLAPSPSIKETQRSSRDERGAPGSAGIQPAASGILAGRMERSDSGAARLSQRPRPSVCLAGCQTLRARCPRSLALRAHPTPFLKVLFILKDGLAPFGLLGLASGCTALASGSTARASGSTALASGSTALASGSTARGKGFLSRRQGLLSRTKEAISRTEASENPLFVHFSSKMLSFSPPTSRGRHDRSVVAPASTLRHIA